MKTGSVNFLEIPICSDLNNPLTFTHMMLHKLTSDIEESSRMDDIYIYTEAEDASLLGYTDENSDFVILY
jgi:hypothetical protein